MTGHFELNTLFNQGGVDCSSVDQVWGHIILFFFSTCSLISTSKIENNMNNLLSKIRGCSRNTFHILMTANKKKINAIKNIFHCFKKGQHFLSFFFFK